MTAAKEDNPLWRQLAKLLMEHDYDDMYDRHSYGCQSCWEGYSVQGDEDHPPFTADDHGSECIIFEVQRLEDAKDLQALGNVTR